jgi:hypothetical protein
MDAPVSIPLSKSKLYLSVLLSLMFVALGFWMLSGTPQSDHVIFGNKTLMMITGLVSIGFFGLAGFTAFRKISDSKPGLLVDAQGITDNSSGLAVGHIPWADIRGFNMKSTFNQKFLMVLLNNPEDYINRQTSGFKRNAMRMNLRTHGSPVTLSAGTLKTNMKDLQALLESRLNAYRQRQQS